MVADDPGETESRAIKPRSTTILGLGQDGMNAVTCLPAGSLGDFEMRLRHPHLGELLFPFRRPGNSNHRAACTQRLQVVNTFKFLILSVCRKQGANSAPTLQQLCNIPQHWEGSALFVKKS
jgi:hypothetical protein